jgi:hypothetical protein
MGTCLSDTNIQQSERFEVTKQFTQYSNQQEASFSSKQLNPNVK